MVLRRCTKRYKGAKLMYRGAKMRRLGPLQLEIYKDDDGARKEDIASLHGDEPFKCVAHCLTVSLLSCLRIMYTAEAAPK